MVLQGSAILIGEDQSARPAGTDSEQLDLEGVGKLHIPGAVEIRLLVDATKLQTIDDDGLVIRV
jgi:hypothetical protein